jgi:hypothetical protein
MAKSAGTMAPPLTGELHSHIRNSLIAGLPSNISTSQFGFTPVNRFANGAPLSAGSSHYGSYQPPKGGRGRKPGSKNKPKFPQMSREDRSEYDFDTGDEREDSLLGYSEKKEPMDLMPLAQPVKSGRGRKPGSKNKPKVPQPLQDEKRDYVFNSDDEKADEPMTYAEKKELSHNINQLPSTKLTKVLQIIASGDRF